MFKKIIFVSIMTSSLLSLVSCKWRDDFRDGQQPQMLEKEHRPTFNADSDDYVGDAVAGRGKYKNNDDVPVPDIDDLSEIPAVPDHPTVRH